MRVAELTEPLASHPSAPAASDASAGMAAMEKRAAEYHARAVAFARALRKPPFHPETVHRLRTHLRRLQAYAELLQHPIVAARLAQSVTWLSRLRTLDVFYHYLRRRKAPAKDLRRVAWALKEEAMMVASTGRLEAIKSMLAKMTLARMRRPVAFVENRLSALRGETSEHLAAALRKLSPEATRKELHRLRLLVKSLRYKEEIALETAWADPHRMMAFKRLQRTLGDYCDRDQFRRLAKKMKLACRSEIKKEYRQYHEKAREAVRKLGPPEEPASDLR
jgi:CHAD domain-containing protein